MFFVDPVPFTRSLNWILPLFRRALESLINFAYGGVVKIDNQNVQGKLRKLNNFYALISQFLFIYNEIAKIGLMVGASFLQLNKVRDACADFLISR